MGRDTLKAYKAKSSYLTLKQKEYLFREINYLNKRVDELVKQLEQRKSN